MDDIEFLQGFVPTDTDASPHDVFSAGPGVDVGGLYAAGGEYGVVTIGGYTPSVGATGGYIVGSGLGKRLSSLSVSIANANVLVYRPSRSAIWLGC